MSFFRSLKGSYESIISTGNFLQHLFLLLIRLYWGYLFQAAGFYKFEHLRETAAGFSEIGIPLSHIMVYLVAAIEFVGGWSLILGLGSRLFSIPLIIVMIIALFTAHYSEASLALIEPSKFMAAAPITFLFTSLIVFLFGPGWISFDYLIETIFFRKKNSEKDS